MNKYKCLGADTYNNGQLKLVPIRHEDRFEILKMRNEQVYHLRQATLLNEEMQDFYFKNVIANLYDQEKPNQILFSVLKDESFIGYGGLVHLNWLDRHGEISFIMKTELEKDFFEVNWKNYLDVLSDIAFNDIKLHKIFTYAFDLRPHLYGVLLSSGFYEEARLKEHSCFNNKYIDVVIHSKINPNAHN